MYRQGNAKYTHPYDVVLDLNKRYHAKNNTMGRVRPRDAVDTISILMVIAGSTSPFKKKIIAEAEQLWRQYFDDGWMVSKVLAMGQKDKERLVTLYARCITYGRYELLERLVHSDLFHYRSFVRAYNIHSDLMQDDFYYRHCYDWFFKIRALEKYGDVSRLKVKVIDPMDKFTGNFFQMDDKMTEIVPLCSVARRVELGNAVKFNEDYEKMLYYIESHYGDREKKASTANISQIYNDITVCATSSQSVPSLQLISKWKLHEDIVGMQATMEHRAQVYWALGIPPRLAYQLLNDRTLYARARDILLPSHCQRTRIYKGERELTDMERNIALPSYELILKIYGECNEKAIVSQVLKQTISANPDLKNTIKEYVCFPHRWD